MSDDDAVADLLQAGGKRAVPPKAFMTEVEKNTRLAWQQAVQAQKRKRQKQWLSAAATAACMALVFFVALPKSSVQPTLVAKINSQNGEVFLSKEGTLTLGSQVRTQAGYISLELPDHTMLMLGANSELHLTGPAEVALLQGQVYVDSPDHTTQVLIHTPRGDIVDIGTQYQVNVSPEALTVAMREGLTEITVGKDVYQARVNQHQGDVVQISQHGVVRSQVARDDASWQWVRDGYSDFNLQQATVSELLNWASRVTAHSLEYSSAQVAEQAQAVRFSGGVVTTKDIEQQLPFILQTAHFTLHQGNGIWHIDALND